MSQKSKVVLAASGGMDSAVLLYKAARDYDEVYVVSFDYGQRHRRELDCLKKQIESVSAKQTTKIVPLVLDVSFIKTICNTSSLTNDEIDNPDISKMAGDAQPTSYVAFRNQMFLSICCSYAESIGAQSVWYGATKVDSLAGYWDADNTFIIKVNELIALNRLHKIEIVAPLIELDKADIVKLGIKLGVDFADTWTCYSNREDGLADAKTPSSSLRLKGFIDAGYRDPIQYIQQDAINSMYDSKGCKPVNYWTI